MRTCDVLSYNYSANCSLCYVHFITLAKIHFAKDELKYK